MGATESLSQPVQSCVAKCDGGKCRAEQLSAVDTLGLPWRWDAENLQLVTRDGDSVLVAVRKVGGTIDVAGDKYETIGRGIADAVNIYYKANPCGVAPMPEPMRDPLLQ